MANPSKTRLSPEALKSIQDCILGTLSSYGAKCQEIAIFGSQANLLAKGGDIDLYIRFAMASGALDSFALKLNLQLGLQDVAPLPIS